MQTTANVVSSTFDSVSCSSGGQCNAVDITTFQSVLFRGNTIIDNIASSIVRLQAIKYWYTDEPVFSLIGNVFRDNRASQATSGQFAVLSIGANGASSWEVQGNEFSNPSSLFEITTFEYTGGSPTEMQINGTNNLFGFEANPSEAEVGKAIWDARDDDSKPEFVFTPFLTSDFEVLCASNCTNRGACTFPGFCICEPGWGGERCDSPTCQNLDFCSGHGSCLSFDECDCEDGWLGEACAVSDCSEVR